MTKLYTFSLAVTFFYEHIFFFFICYLFISYRTFYDSVLTKVGATIDIPNADNASWGASITINIAKKPEAL